ncbi:hypothetical protein BGX28_000104 [Mortierella sp. GBA30]|nr:hypothetical protein BGX28_000104 [Mortierella sp. GBA30]
MVKFTTFIMATVAIMAYSTSAQVSIRPKAVTAAEFESYTAVDALANADILPYPAPHDNVSLERRGEPTQPKKPKSKKKPQPKKPSKASAKLSSEQQLILNAHNKYRAKHQAPPLVWNNNAANFGNNWIQQCQFRHSRGRFGENLAYGYRDFNAVVDAWYNEVRMYNYNNPGFTMQTGHFTQVVWKGTKSVGCAKKNCGGSMGYIYICNYEAGGNIVGNNNMYFRQNVLPPKRS